VVVVEIFAAVLEQAEGGDAGFGEGGDVGSGGIGAGLEEGGSDALEDGLKWAEGVDSVGGGFDAEA
jgi:hypothetical protein